MSAQVPVLAPHAQRSAGWAPARGGRPRTNVLHRLDPEAPVFVPGAPVRVTMPDRTPLPAVRPVSPAEALQSGQLLHARLLQSPSGPQRDDALFVLEEMFKRPLAAGEAIFLAGDAAAPAGLLRAGAPIRAMPGFDCPTMGVQQILADPPGRGTGAALIQSTVNHAMRQGCILRLQSLGGADTAFYDRLGFRQYGPWRVLDPAAEPSKWTKRAADDWQFRRST